MQLKKWIRMEDITCLFICLNLYNPRMFGQRPSLLKWFFGRKGEVLQVLYDTNGSTVPKVRFAASLFADLPGKSYSSDLINANARILPVIQYGGNGTCAIMMMTMINLAVMSRFGLNKRVIPELRFDQHPVLFGGWMALPHHLLEFGFDANLIRLLAMAEDNEQLARELQLLMMTDKVWNFSHRLNELETTENTKALIDNDLMTANHDYGKAVTKEDYSLIGDTLIDFEIVFSRYLKTLQSFTRQMNLYEKEIDKLDREKHITIESKGVLYSVSKDQLTLTSLENKEIKLDKSERLKKLYYELTPFYLYKMENYELKVVRMLNAYTTKSFQEGYLRIPISTQTINRLGYSSRIMTEPFNKTFFNKPEKERREWSISEIISDIKTIASRRDIVIPSENIKLYDFTKKIYSNAWNDMLNKSFTTELKIISPEIQNTKIEELPYIKVRRTVPGSEFGYKNKELVGLVIEVLARHKKKEDTILYTARPWLIYDERFELAFNLLENLLRGISFTEASLEKNTQVMVRLTSTKDTNIILKTKTEKITEEFYEYRGMLGWTIKLSKYEQSINTIIHKGVKISLENFNAAVLKTFILINVFNITNINISHAILGSQRVPFDINSLIEEMMKTSSILTKMEISTLTAAYSLNKNYKLLYCKVVDNENKKDIIIKDCINHFGMSDYYKVGEIDRSIDSITITSIFIISTLTNIMMCLETIEQNVIVIKSKMEHKEFKLLLKMAVYFLDKRSMYYKRLDELVTKGPGQYIFNKEGALSKQTGEWMIFDSDFGKILSYANTVQEDDKIITDGNILKFRNKELEDLNSENEKIKYPYLLTPWQAKLVPRSIKIYNLNNNLLINTKWNSIEMKERFSKINQFIIEKLYDIGFKTESLKDAFKIILTCSYINKSSLLSNSLFNNLRTTVNKAKLIKETLKMEVKTVEGTKFVELPFEKPEEIQDSEITKIVDLLIDRDSFYELGYEQLMVIYFTLLYVEVHCSIPILKMGNNILSTVEVEDFETEEMQNEKFLIHLLTTFTPETVLQEIMRNNQKFKSNDDKSSFYKYNAIYTIENKTIKTWKLKHKRMMEGNTSSMNSITRINYLNSPGIRVINCSNELTELVLYEIIHELPVYEFVRRLNQESRYWLYGRSRIKDELMEPLMIDCNIEFFRNLLIGI